MAAVIVVAGAVIIETRLVGQGGSAREPVSGSRGGSVTLSGARLSVRPGAVAGHGTLMASTGSGAPATGPGMGLRLAGAAGPVHFQVTGARVSGALEVSFRVGAIGLPLGMPASARGDAVWLAYYDPSAGFWRPVASRYDPAAGTVTAMVGHLSWWAPWTWDWSGFALRLRQALSAFGSGRAPAASCAGIAKVTVTSAGGQDPPLIGCAVSHGDGKLTVSLTNNRGVSVVTSGVPPDAGQVNPSYRGFDEFIATRPAVTRALGGADLPPSQTLTYSLPQQGPPVVFTAAPTVASYVLDVAAAIGEGLLDEAEFAKVSGAYATCILNAIAGNTPASFADAPPLALQCLPALAHAVPALARLGSLALGLLIEDTRLLLQDYDLAHDAFRGIRGAVTVTRPAGAPQVTDWRNTTYTTTCGSWTPQPVTVTVRNGTGRYSVSGQTPGSYLDLQVMASARLGGASSPTAVLLRCTPYPADFFVTEIHIFTPARRQIGAAVQAPNLLHAYPPYFDGQPFSFSNGTLQTGAQYYTSCHACGTVRYLLAWQWTGTRLKFLSADQTPTSQTFQSKPEPDNSESAHHSGP